MATPFSKILFYYVAFSCSSDKVLTCIASLTKHVIIIKVFLFIYLKTCKTRTKEQGNGYWNLNLLEGYDEHK